MSKRNLTLVLLLLSGMQGLWSHAARAAPATGGAACIMAKWRGNTLDYALVSGKSRPAEAREEAERLLKKKGYADFKSHVNILHPQAASDLSHAYALVIHTRFKTQLGVERTSYGCGFSAQSYDEALWAAIRDLQTYSWGWIPDRDGYEVVQRLRY